MGSTDSMLKPCWIPGEMVVQLKNPNGAQIKAANQAASKTSYII